MPDVSYSGSEQSQDKEPLKSQRVKVMANGLRQLFRNIVTWQLEMG